MMPTLALQIARHIVRESRTTGEPITNLKLQKLLYYCQGWHLAYHEKVLFSDPIQAWVHGPAVPNVYRSNSTPLVNNICQASKRNELGWSDRRTRGRAEIDQAL